MFRLVSNRVDHKARTVTSVTLGLFSRSTAVYRPGYGCTLAVGASPAQLRKQGAVFATPQITAPASAAWPRGEAAPLAALVSNPNGPRGKVTQGGITVDVGALRRALDAAFAEPFGPHKRQSHAVAIVYKGQLIAERYAPGFNHKTPVLGWSMSKTVTAVLA